MNEALVVLKAPCLPCWYCEGRDGDGRDFNPKTHTGWACKACVERYGFRQRLQRIADIHRGIFPEGQPVQPITLEEWDEIGKLARGDA